MSLSDGAESPTKETKKSCPTRSSTDNASKICWACKSLSVCCRCAACNRCTGDNTVAQTKRMSIQICKKKYGRLANKTAPNIKVVVNVIHKN